MKKTSPVKPMCVVLTVLQIFSDRIVIQAIDGTIAKSIPISDIYLNDPADHSVCVPAINANKELRARCVAADYVFAWAPFSLVHAVPLKRHHEPAPPPELVPS